MKRIVLAILTMVLIIPSVSFAKRNKDLTGFYTVEGFMPGVSTSGEPSYTGTLEISQTGGAYKLKWNVGLGGTEVYEGVGIYTNGVLSVGYNEGVISYRVEGKELKGVWAPSSGGIFGYEYCKRQLQ